MYSFSTAQSIAGSIATKHCLDNIELIGRLIVGIPNKYHTVGVLVNGRELVEGRDFIYTYDSSRIDLSFLPVKGDTICYTGFEMALLPDFAWRVKKPEDIPLLGDDTLNVSEHNQVYRNSAADSASLRYKVDYGGNKSILVTVGEGGNLHLEQSLQLDIKGQVSQNVFIKGYLSDQEIPIQPEGNTATLKEVDNIYITIYGRQFEYTLGDYQLNFGQSGIDQTAAQVQGVRGSYIWKEYITQGAFSLSQGQFYSNIIAGRYGKQSGYFLTGKEGELYITVLAGTEKIWVNGNRLKRGWDYLIEYGEARVDFLNTVIISGEDIITVEFQYTQRIYPGILYLAELSDTSGSVKWSLRSITEKDNEDSPEGFILNDDDKEYLASIGDSVEKARIIPTQTPYQGSQWETDLYYVDSITMTLLPVTIQTFDSINNSSQQIYKAQYINLPREHNHHAMTLQFDKWKGHESMAHIFISQLDKNLYSTVGDNGNVGGGFVYNGTQTLGQAFNKGGWGKYVLKVNSEIKSRNYNPLNQIVEPYKFSDKWNVSSIYAKNDCWAHNVIMETMPVTELTFGGEYGLTRGRIPVGNFRETASSRRIKGYMYMGNNERQLRISTEKKNASSILSNTRGLHDNYKTEVGGAYRLGAVSPKGAYTQDEWIMNYALGGGNLGLRKKWTLGVDTKPLFHKIKASSSVNFLDWESTFENSLKSPGDSLRARELTAKLDLFDLGLWQSDIFLAYQIFNVRSDAQSVFQEKDYKLMEWNQSLYNDPRGYRFRTYYRINQTEEVPLVQSFEKVNEGTGTYSCQSLPVANGLGLQCVADETGDYIPIGLVRDTLSQEISYQDLELNGNLVLVPRQLIEGLEGVLSDIKFSMNFALSHQDSASSSSLLPLFTDGSISKLLGGRSEYEPSLQWRSTRGQKGFYLKVKRQFSKVSLPLLFEELRWYENARFTHAVNGRWSWAVRQLFEFRNKVSPTLVLSEMSDTYGYGVELQRHFTLWSILLTGDYSTTRGVAESSRNFTQNSIYPKTRLEHKFVKGGSAYCEYGFNYLWGSGNRGALFLWDGYKKGLTHRVELSLSYQLGQYIHAFGNYVIRKEPGRQKLFQKLTAEVKAIF